MENTEIRKLLEQQLLLLSEKSSGCVYTEISNISLTMLEIAKYLTAEQ